MKFNRPTASASQTILEQLEPRILFSGTNFVVSSLADVVASDGVVTLREALKAANTNSAVTDDVLAGSDTETDLIMFDAAALAAEAGAGNPLTIFLNGSDLTISDDVNIFGLGQDVLTIDANDASRVIDIDGSGVEVLLSGLTLTGGFGYYAGVYNNSGELTMTGVTVNGNAGIGIYNDHGELILIGVTVVGNGGTGISGSGPMTMTNVISSGNDGNGISASAPLELGDFKQFAYLDTHYAWGGDDALSLTSPTGDGTITFDFAGDTDDAGSVIGALSISIAAGAGGGTSANHFSVNQLVDLINVESQALQTGYNAASSVYNAETGQYGVKLTANSTGYKSLFVGGTVVFETGHAWGTTGNWDQTAGSDANVFNNYDNIAATLTNVTVSDNGGIGIENSGALTMTGGTVSGNADGGIYNNSGALTMTGVTVSGNDGGGIYNYHGELTLMDVTVVGNGGTGIAGSGTMTLTNVISSGNDGSGISASATLELSGLRQFAYLDTHYASGDDYALSLTSPTDDGTITFTFAGDTDDAGAAMGAITIAIFAGAGGGTTDYTYTVNQLIGIINATSQAKQTGYNAASLVLNSQSGQYGVKLTANATGVKTLTVAGTATLAATGTSWITDANWDETSGAATGFNIDDNTAATLTNVTVSDNGGIGIENSGELTMTGGTVSGNGKGGIYNLGTLIVTDSVVRGNSAENGGGIYISDGTVTLTNSTVSGNSASEDGGGIYNGSHSTLTINNIIVALNGAGLDGDEIEGDWTGSGNQIGVDQVDMDVLIHDILGTEYGDANLDGKVSLADLTIVSTNYGITSGATWLQGDFNGDGAVSLADITILSSNFGFDSAAAPVTVEPVAPAEVEPETTSPARPSAMAAHWQSQQSGVHNSQRSTLRLLNSRPKNMWLSDDLAEDDEVDLLAVPELLVI